MNKKKAGFIAVILFLFVGMTSFAFASTDKEELSAEMPERKESVNSEESKEITKNDSSESTLITDGNQGGSQVNTQSITDETAPVFTGLSNGMYYQDDITVNVEDTNLDKITAKVYADNYKVIEIENGSKLTKESIYLLTATDKAGNETSIYVAVDKTNPVFTTVKNGHQYNKDTEIEVKDNNLDTITVYNYETKETSIVENGYVLKEEGTYKITATDKAGRSAFVYVEIDKTKPVIALHKNTAKSEKEPGYHNYCVSATVTEANLKSFKLNGEDYKAGTVICNDGNYNLVATDKAGNQDEISFRVDRTKPVIKINGAEYQGTNNTGMFYNKVNLEINESNEHDIYVWKDGKKVNFNEVDFNQDGYYKVKVRDASKNISEVEFTVDTIPVKLVDIRVNSNNKNERYAKVGDYVGIYLNVNEELRENPTFVINGQTYKVNQTAVNNGQYMYAVLFTVTDETKEELVNFNISNIYDKAGNKLEDLSNNNTKEYVIVDKTAPTININNWKDLTLKLGDTYEDEGATATDNIDGDISDKIEVSYLYYNEEGVLYRPHPTEIKLDKLGQFVIKYTVNDNAGNRREMARRINVVNE